MQLKWRHGLLIGLTQLFLQGASAATAVPAVPVDIWNVQTKPGDALTLADQEGVLRMDYDVDVKDTYQLGHLTFKQATCRLLLKTPVALEKNQTRIVFEAKGMKKLRDRMAFLQLLPLLRDEKGETLLYEPFPYPHLKDGTENWGKWTTRYFYGAEAGGATQNIFQAEGGDGNGWPDGKLTFLGFELQIRPDKLQREKGTLYLNDISFGDMKIPYEDPYIYADAFFKAKGNYRFAAQMSNEFQAVPFSEFEKTVGFDPASAKSQLQRLYFPLGPDGNYWIRYQITDESGKLVAGDFMRHEVAGSPVREALKAVDIATPPSLGYMRVNPENHSSGVYGIGESFIPTVRLFPKGSASLELKWKLVPYHYDTVIQKGETKVSFGGKAFVDIPLALEGEGGRDAYRLLLEVSRDGKTLDTCEYLMGRKTDLSKPRDTRRGLVRGRDYVKKSAYFRTTFNPPDFGKSEDEYIGHFINYLDEATKMAPYVTYMVDLADFEVLPGVYDLAILDRVMDEAADRGAAITVRIAHADAKVRFRWLQFSRERSYDDTEIYNHFYGCYSAIDPVYLKCWLDANRILFARYKNHPAFQGYYLMMAGGESAVLDKPYLGITAGYEQTMKTEFRKYLRDIRKFTLDQLNARWGTKYGDWEQVEVPLPDFSGGTKPDMRVSWLDFCMYKHYLNTEFWFLTLAKDIRSYDQEHVIIVYCAEGEVMKGIADYDHGGGVPGMPGNGSAEQLWLKYHVGAIQEPHHPHRWNAYGDPNNRGWVLDWDLYTMISSAGGGGANIHVYYFPEGPIVGHYGLEHAYDRYEQFKPVFREMQELKLVNSGQKQVATFQDLSTLFTKHRTNFLPRLADLNRFFDMLTFDGVEAEKLRPELLASYKLVLPNPLDEVMTRENIEMLDGYARGGGKMIISALTGRFCPELGNDPFPLLKRLGITAPTGPYVQEGADVLADVTADNPFFDRNAKVKFYTLSNLKSDPDRPEVREKFFLWPYRWIPQTDYFGYYRDNTETNGQVLARFASGGVALSLHNVGKGQVLVFWGIPEYTPQRLSGFMSKAAQWAGVVNPAKDNPIRLMIEGKNDSLKRHYAILWQETPGKYIQKVPGVPDGTYFIDEMLSSAKFGTFTGKELREQGLPVEFRENYSPLMVIRMIPGQPSWAKNYRMPVSDGIKEKSN